MAHINFEFKARVRDITEAEKKLLQLAPLFMGEDYQKDTYYNARHGRLKLREGIIENALIYYERENLGAAKQSNVILYIHKPDEQLKMILDKVHGIKVIVVKKRKIYYNSNVKIHFDEVEQLGSFIEVEAIDKEGVIDIEILKKQCYFFADFFGISSDNYISHSYSDMLLMRKDNKMDNAD